MMNDEILSANCLGQDFTFLGAFKWDKHYYCGGAKESYKQAGDSFK